MIRKRLRKVLPYSWFRKPTRLDHGRMYMSVMVGLFVTGFSMFLLGPLPNSTINKLDTFTQLAMSFVLSVSSGMCILGFLRGTRLYKPQADIRDSYRIAKWSVIALGGSLGTYVIAIFSAYGNLLLSALSGSLGLSILIGSLWNSWDFANEIDNLNSRLNRVTPNE